MNSKEKKPKNQKPLPVTDESPSNEEPSPTISPTKDSPKKPDSPKEGETPELRKSASLVDPDELDRTRAEVNAKFDENAERQISQDS